ncbi:polymorphic toxin-type HINT domain-containing protein [Kitasatospora sp. NPDC101183]|uniref:polymorphic toxin-type HINT domain-containing protein n=1 Tax=Kitasatospora sp. NPDC101183 TaxID=3364100 RepID=UPI00381C0D28
MTTPHGSSAVELAAPPSADSRETRQDEAGKTVTEASAGASTKAGDLPVWLAPLPRDGQAGPAKDAPTKPSVQVEVTDARTAASAGSPTNLVALTPTDPSNTTKVRVSLDASAFGAGLGGDWSRRARLYTLPACSLTTPQAEGCLERKPVESHYDAQSGKLVADVDLPAAAAGTGTAPAPKAGTTQAAFRTALTAGAAAPAAAPTVLAADAPASGGAGTYSATSLAPSQSWTAGEASGAFSYSYPIQAPPSIGAAAPKVTLGYSSTAVDGRTSSTNSQASWIGDGWDYGPGFVERSYRPCSKDGITGSGDQCWGEANLVLSLAGHSGELVPDDASCPRTAGPGEWSTCTWRLRTDDGSRIEFLTGATNGTWNGSYIKLTDASGTAFYFGLNHLPSATGTPTTTGPDTNSAWTVPVYSPNSGDPCYDAGKGKDSWCQSAWRWNLDFEVDVKGNLTTYSYVPETNFYARGGGQNRGKGTNTAYTRGGVLASIGYGQLLSDQLNAGGNHRSAARIDFDSGERCVTGAAACDPAQRTVANAANWPDVPVDRQCTQNDVCANYGPSYFTTKWLNTVTTRIRSGNGYRDVDSYTLNHVLKAVQNSTENTAVPWLSSVQRTAKDDFNGQAPVAVPPVTFADILLPNRVDGAGPSRPAYNRPRIASVTTETGAAINVDYYSASCSRSAGVMPASADDNKLACFNVKWYQPNSTADSTPVDDWFLRYPVKTITVDPRSDLVKGALPQTTAYTYGDAAWHRNDARFVDAKDRTWDDFRGFATVTAVTGTAKDGVQGQTSTTYHQGMDGDITASGAKRSRTVTGPMSGAVTDSDWLAGQVLESDTYPQAGASEPVAYSVTTSSGPTTTATHARGDGLPDLVARYTSTTSTVTAKARKVDGSWRTTTDTTTTDPAHGNRPVTVLNQADGTPDVCARTTYATGTDPAMTGLASQVLSVSGPDACTATPTAANTLSGTRTVFDGAAFGSAGARGEASSIQVLEKYDGSGNAQWTTTGRSTYDAYGRAVTVTDPTTTDSAHPDGAATTTAYGSANPGELPNATTITSPAPAGAPDAATGRVSTATLNPARALPITETDVNGRTVTQAYDGLGRLTSVWLAGRTTADKANFTFAYTVAAGVPSTVTTGRLRANGSYAQSVQIMDGLARVVQTQADPAISAYHGRMITDTYYDSQGRTNRLNTTYYNDQAGPGSTRFEPEDAKVPNQTYTVYDGQGRPTSVQFRAYGVAQNATTTAYPGVDRTDVTPPAGATPTSAVTDARGRATQLWQYRTPTATGNPADADVTTYAFNPAGKETFRTDAAGNTWSYTYDQRGRRTGAGDPDAGTSSTTYDAAGRVASSTNAGGQTVVTTYDLLGRRTGTYNGTVSPANQLTGYTYDTVAKGRATGSTRYVGGAGGSAYTSAVVSMDAGYRPTKTTLTIPGGEVGQANPVTYTTSAKYDPITGSKTEETRPTVGDVYSETIVYTYEVYGLLSKFGALGGKTYDLQSDYDAYGRNIRSTMNPWGTQVVTTSTYDEPTGRILNQYVDKQTSTTGTVQNTTYAYNRAGRVTAIRTTPDNAPTATDQQCFAYDYLGRLTTAWSDTGRLDQAPNPSVGGQGACANSSPTSGAQAPARTTVGGYAPYWQTYQYDLTGNRTQLVTHDAGGDTAKDTTVTQTFPSAGTRNAPTTAPNSGGGTGGPHALLSSTSATGTSTPTTSTTQYDASGRTTAITDTNGTATLTWNGEDRLDSLTRTGSGTTTYVYDAGGNQLVRHNPGRTTINIGGDELTVDTATKQLTGARYYEIPGGTTLVRQGGGRLTYQISDHHGTGVLGIDSATLAESRRPSDPFGNLRGTPPSSWAGDKGFVGGTKDDVTGLTNLGARQYQPTTGRFLSLDPILDRADPQQWNGYAYSGNDPVNRSDPSGEFAVWGPFGGGGFHDPQPGNIPLRMMGLLSDEDDGENVAAVQKAHEAKEKAEGAKQKVLSVGKELAKIAADELGITDAFNCVTKGDLGACGETVLNIATSLIGGGPLAKLAKKYAFHWGKAYDLAKTVKRLANELYDGFKAWRAESKAAREAEQIVTSCPLRGPKTHSFRPDTPVLLADGSTKPIKDIKQGDTVLSTDPQTDTTGAEPVTATIVTPDDRQFTDLTLAADDKPAVTLTSTQHHPYWDETTQRWTAAADIHAGDRLRAADGTLLTVRATRSYDTQPQEAHDLSVADLHTYYVLAGTTPVLVHNCAGGGSTPIYRGVSEISGQTGELNPAFDDAVMGIARPRGGPNTPEMHQYGRTESDYTSWTTSEAAAHRAAVKNGGTGVVIEGTIPAGRFHVHPNEEPWGEESLRGEMEVIIQGEMRGVSKPAYPGSLGQ